MTLHAFKPNEVLHFYNLYLREGTDDQKYVFVINDDFSGYCLI